MFRAVSRLSTLVDAFDYPVEVSKDELEIVAMRKAGWSVEYLARRFGYTQRTIRRILADGKRKRGPRSADD